MLSQGFFVEKGATPDQLVTAVAYFTDFGLYCQLEDDTEPRVFWAVSFNPEEDPIEEFMLDHVTRFGLTAGEIV